MIGSLGWVTTRTARGLDPDEPLAVPALERAGVTVTVVDWDDPRADWSAFDRVVLRSPWDYPDRLADFVAWYEHVDAVTDVRNPLALARWSLDKRYLADLDAAGVAVTPTEFCEPGARADLHRFEGGFVVKPAVGAGSRDAARYHPSASDRDAAAAHIERLHARGVTALVQPLLESVAREGEWPMVYLGGEFSHAASKRVELPHASAVAGLFAVERNAPAVATPHMRAVADAAMAVAARFGAGTFGRVDLVLDEGGRHCVMELELVEPSLFLPEAPDAVERFVAAITA